MATLDRAEVRRALLMAIDREDLVRSLYGSEGRVAHAPAAGGDLPAGVERYDYAPRASSAVLEAAGLRDVELVLTRGPVCSPEWMHRHIFPRYEEYWSLLGYGDFSNTQRRASKAVSF